jgi:hypothetical protein
MCVKDQTFLECGIGKIASLNWYPYGSELLYWW